LSVAILGCGVVGEAVKHSLNDEPLIVDPKHNDSVTLDFCVKNNVSVYVLCLPTPPKKDGSCDGSIVMSSYNHIISNAKNNPLVILKSTITPDYLEEMTNTDSVDFVYVPEFIRQSTHINDYLTSKFHIVGGKPASRSRAISFLKSTNISAETFFETDVFTACFAKYAVNAFLATKVAFFNSLYDLYISFFGSDKGYDALVSAIALDDRIGTSHMQVPGPDGTRGFGGACFPKDTLALTKFANKYDVDMEILNRVIEYNNKIRNIDNTTL